MLKFKFGLYVLIYIYIKKKHPHTKESVGHVQVHYIQIIRYRTSLCLSFQHCAKHAVRWAVDT